MWLAQEKFPENWALSSRVLALVFAELCILTVFFQTSVSGTAISIQLSLRSYYMLQGCSERKHPSRVIIITHINAVYKVKNMQQRGEGSKRGGIGATRQSVNGDIVRDVTKLRRREQ